MAGSHEPSLKNVIANRLNFISAKKEAALKVDKVSGDRSGKELSGGKAQHYEESQLMSFEQENPRKT